MSVVDGSRILYEVPSPDEEGGVTSVCEVENDVSHTFFARGRVAEDRRELSSKLGVLASNTIVKVMLSSEDACLLCPRINFV